MRPRSANAGPKPGALAVWAANDDDTLRSRAARLAGELRLPLITGAGPKFPLLLAVTPQRLELRSTASRGPGPVYVDFVGGRLGYNLRAGRFGRLFDAIGSPSSVDRVVDATTGLGQDAFLLAYYGYHVTAVERSPVVAALLSDGISRAYATPNLAKRLRDRLNLIHADARAYLKTLEAVQAPAVVYLDPMYPLDKRTALVRKELRVLRQIVGDDEDAAELFEIARRVARRRVVVKRMRLAPALGPAPTRNYPGRAVRYDVYDV